MAKSSRAGGMPDYLSVPEVSRFTSRRGKVHIEIGDAADGRQEPENANDYPPVPKAGAAPARALRTRSAISVGGLAGNNAHGAGFLEALRRSGKVPQIVSCTSGQILHVAEWLKGTDLQVYFEQAMQTTQPFGEWTDANLIYKQISAGSQAIRPSVLEFPTDVAANIGRSWMRALTDPSHFSFFRELSNWQPARTLVPAFPADFYQDIAEVLARSDVGVMFNAYDIESGHEYVYLNEAAQKLTGKSLGRHHFRSWIEYRPVNAESVEQALYLYQYGFNSGTRTVDGAYVRDVILSEIPSPHNEIDRIAAVRPQPDNWLGEMPQSNVELQSLQTQVAFNAAYIGERERIRLMNRLIGQMKWDSQPRHIAILELPLCEPRTHFDYVVESDLIFRSAFWRGAELAKSL